MSRRKSLAVMGLAFGLLTFGATGPVLAADAASVDRDEAELLKYFDKVDVWHYPVDTTVRYNNQDSVVTREAGMQPAPGGDLC